MLVEEILKLFISNIYAQLFKGIVHEIFKTENVQYSNEIVFSSERKLYTYIHLIFSIC